MSQLDYHNITASNAVYSDFNGKKISTAIDQGNPHHGWQYLGIGTPWSRFPVGIYTLLYLWCRNPGQSTTWGVSMNFTQAFSVRMPYVSS